MAYKEGLGNQTALISKEFFFNFSAKEISKNSHREDKWKYEGLYNNVCFFVWFWCFIPSVITKV